MSKHNLSSGVTPSSLSLAPELPGVGRFWTRLWLVALAVMIAAMVVIGGVTRLTESGLSITEWKPVTGTLPPLSDAAWQEAYEKYQQIPEYQQVHFGMSLAEFKNIFFWEYLHRLWGRLIGLVALAVPVILLARQGASRRRGVRLLAVPVLVLMQGVLGWYMVMSGLSARISVSQYRLTAHLVLALVIYGLVVWMAARLGPAKGASILPIFRRVCSGFFGLVFLTIMAGGFTAGLKAGLVYNSFPLMDGRLIPDGYWSLSPWWLNFFETIETVQFNHRLLAMTTFCAAIGLVCWAFRAGMAAPVKRATLFVLGAVLVQVALGISTLLLVVPVGLAAAHQAGAILLFTSAILLVHAAGGGATGEPR